MSKRRVSTRFLKRHILESDMHPFVGRVYDLSIVGYNFDSYDELAQHADCKYVLEVAGRLSALVRRVESLNLVGSMLWPEPMPNQMENFPVSLYEWLTVSQDAFLMRYISVVDCALILTNQVFECGLRPQRCTIPNLQRKGVPEGVLHNLKELVDEQGHLRGERNTRVHHGVERAFTQTDQSFRLAALFGHRSNGITGVAEDGRPINLNRMFKEGLVDLQREFNQSTRRLSRRLKKLYDELGDGFESTFVPKFRVRTHSYGSGERNSVQS